MGDMKRFIYKYKYIYIYIYAHIYKSIYVLKQQSAPYWPLRLSEMILSRGSECVWRVFVSHVHNVSETCHMTRVSSLQLHKTTCQGRIIDCLPSPNSRLLLMLPYLFFYWKHLLPANKKNIKTVIDSPCM